MNNMHITLDFIRHEKAREKVAEKLSKMDMTERDIIALEIVVDHGFFYKVVVFNRFSFTVFDDGTEAVES